MWISISICSLIIFLGLLVFLNAKKLSTKKIPQEYPEISWKASGFFIIIIAACLFVFLLVFVHDVDIALSSGAVTVSIFVMGGIIAVAKSISIIKEDRKERIDIKEATKNLSSLFYEDFSGTLGSINLHVKERHPDFAKLLYFEAHQNSMYTDVPKRYIYTSATVGGVTTGGVTEVGGYTDVTKYSSQGMELRLKYIQNTTGGKEAIYSKCIKRIKLSQELLKNAKKSRISEYIENDCIVVIEDVNISSGILNMPTNSALNAYEALSGTGYPSIKKCCDIIDWLSCQ